MAFTLTNEQMTFATFAFVDDHGQAVPASALTMALNSADPSMVAWEKRDPATGAVDPNGQDCVVAQGPLGTVQVSVVATNADGTSVTLTGDLEVIAADAVGGTITFGPAVAKPTA